MRVTLRDPEEIAILIREKRGNQSLREFAKKCHVTHTTIDNLEKGINFRTGKIPHPNEATIVKISEATGIPVSVFINQNPNESGFKTNIRSLRESRDFSRQYIADSLGVTHQAYANYENGYREPEFAILRKLAEFYGVSSDYLLGMCSKSEDWPFDKNDKQLIEAIEIFYRLDFDYRMFVLSYMKYLDDKQSKDK